MPDDNIEWEFSHLGLFTMIISIFAIFFLGYWTRAWTEPPPPSSDNFTLQPPTGEKFNFTCTVTGE